MGSYSVEWKRSALKELRDLPKEAVSRIVDAVEELSSEPHPQGSRKLVGTDHTYRIRIGDYRIVYSVWASQLVVEIIRVGHRKDVYRSRAAPRPGVTARARPKAPSEPGANQSFAPSLGGAFRLARAFTPGWGRAFPFVD
jgi:mRNA interferase RelE/StbE